MDDHSARLLDGIATKAFAVTWTVLLVAGFVAYRLMSPAEKKRWLPREMTIVGVFFIAFAATFSVIKARSWSGLRILVAVVPAVAVVCYGAIKSTKFCAQCGTIQHFRTLLTPSEYCSRCGARLEAEKPKKADDFPE